MNGNGASLGAILVERSPNSVERCKNIFELTGIKQPDGSRHLCMPREISSTLGFDVVRDIHCLKFHSFVASFPI